MHETFFTHHVYSENYKHHRNYYRKITECTTDKKSGYNNAYNTKQLAVLKFEDWFSFLNNSVILRLSRRDWSMSEYEIMLNIIRKLNNIRKNPSICFLFAIGRPSSYFREEPEELPEEPEDFSRLR